MLDIGVDTARVGFKQPPVMCGEARCGLFRCTMQAQAAAKAVEFKRRWSDDFREATGADTPVQIHLPEPVLCVDIALGKEEIILIFRVDVRDTILIGNDFDFFVQSVQDELALLARQGAAREKVIASTSDTSQARSREEGFLPP